MKRIALTSRLAFRDLQAELQPRELEVLAALRVATVPPTGYELLQRMQAAHPGFDVNSIRPRLTSLRDRGAIIEGDKRRCTVTGRIALTWIPAAGDEPALPSGPAVQEQARRAQTVLDLGWFRG